MATERIANLGGAGLNSDVMASLLPANALTTATNVYATDSSVESIFGETKLFDLDIRPSFHTSFVDASQVQHVIVSDGLQVYAYSLETGLGEEITPASGVWLGGNVTMTVLNGVLVVNSASDGPFYWPGPANALLPLPGPGDTTYTWLEGAGAPAGGLGVDGDYYLDTDTENAAYPPAEVWYRKVGGAWVSAQTQPDDVSYGWRWRDGWRCAAMADIRYYLVALGMSENAMEYPHKIRWSNSTQEGQLPTQWAILPSNDAGDDLLGETEGRIVGAVPVRDSLFIVKHDALYAMNWVQGNSIFQTSRLHGGIGTDILGGFCEMHGNIVIMTSSDVQLFDGQNMVSIVDHRVRRALFQGISEEYWEHSQVYFHPPTSRLFVAGAAGGSIGQLTTALVYNGEDNTWTIKNLGYAHGFDTALVSLSSGTPSWDELETAPAGGVSPNWLPGEPWDSQVDGTWNKGIYQPSQPDTLVFEANAEDTAWWASVYAQSTTNSDGSPKTCLARRVGMPFEGAEGLAQLTGVWVELGGDLTDLNGNTVPVQFRFGAQEQADGELTWYPHTFDVCPGRACFIDVNITGRFLAWEVESFGIGSWRLGALTLEWEPAGEF